MDWIEFLPKMALDWVESFSKVALQAILIEWFVINGLALVVWLAARRYEGLQRRLRTLPVLKMFHEADLTLMERIGFVFALSVTAFPVCYFATSVAVVLLAMPFLFPKGFLASFVAHLAVYAFYRVAKKHPTAREWEFVDILSNKEKHVARCRLGLSVVITLGCIGFTRALELFPD